MASTEKGRRTGDPIPNFVCQDDSESKASNLDLQVFRLTRRCSISADTAEMLAPLVFLEGQR